LHQYDPYWNEIVLDSSEFLEENKQGISLSQLPTEELVKETENNFTVGQRIFSKKENRKGAINKVGKSGFTVDWDGWVTVPYSFSQIEELQLSKIEELDSCLPCSTPTPAQEQLPLQVTNSALKPPNLSKLTTPPNEFLVTDSQTSPFTTTSEPIKGNLNGITSTGFLSPAPEQATLESEKDLSIQSPKCSSIPLERSQLSSLNLLLLNNPEELSTTDLEQCLEDSEWLSTVGKIQKSYQQRNSERPTKEKGCSLLPTPTTYPKGSTGCRPAGTNRLEQKLRPFIHKGDKLHPSVAGWMMGFPIGWVEYPLADTGEMLSVQLPFIPLQDTILKTDGTALTSTDEQLHLNKQRSPLNEFAISQNSPELDNQESELLTPTTPTNSKPQFKTGEYILNGRVGEIIEASPGEYFSVKYGNSHTDLKCYFWGQDDELINSLAIPTERFAIAPQELVEKFLEETLTTEKFLEETLTTEKFVRENNLSTGAEVSLTNDGTEKFVRENISTGAEVSLTNDGTEKFVRENNLSTDVEISLTNNSPAQFVRENNLSTDGEISLTKKKKIASGSLAPFVENKKLKDGTIATYPKVSGERDPLNHLHWRWGYYYEIKIDGEWKNRSLPVAARIVPQVKIMIENHCPVEEIKNAILQSKHQKRGNNS